MILSFIIGACIGTGLFLYFKRFFYHISEIQRMTFDVIEQLGKLTSINSFQQRKIEYLDTFCVNLEKKIELLERKINGS